MPSAPSDSKSTDSSGSSDMEVLRANLNGACDTSSSDETDIGAFIYRLSQAQCKPGTGSHTSSEGEVPSSQVYSEGRPASESTRSQSEALRTPSPALEPIVTDEDLYICTPTILLDCIGQIETLSHCTWVDAALIDLWLIISRRQLPNPLFLLIPSRALNLYAEEIDGPTIRWIRKLTGFPTASERCPLQPVLYIMNSGPSQTKSGNHFCVVVIRPREREVYLLGRFITDEAFNPESSDWGTWPGLRIWQFVHYIYGWDSGGEHKPRLITIDWPQNGYDCGPIATQVVQYLLRQGLQTRTDGNWMRPNFTCGHAQRRAMALGVQTAITEGVPRFLDLLENHSDTLHALDTDGNIGDWAKAGLHLDETHDANIRKISTVVRELENKIRHCFQCDKDRRAGERATTGGAATDLPAMGVQVGDGKHPIRGTAPIRLPAPHPSVPSVTGPTDHRLHATDIRGAARVGRPAPHPSITSPTAPGHGCHTADARFAQLPRPTASDWMDSNIGRFPRPTQQGPDLPPLGQVFCKRLPHCRSFDEYDDCPVAEDNTLPDQFYMLGDPSLMYYLNRVQPTHGSNFNKDYGYRLPRYFAQAFLTGEPYRLRDHLGPVGLAEPPSSISHYNPQPQARHGTVTINDDIPIGAEEALRLVAENENLLLNGMVTIDGQEKHAVIDLQRDSVVPTALEHTCDIDSLVWVTDKPTLQSGAMNVWLAPVIRKQPPLAKTNHIRVVLYPPPSEAEHIPGRKREDDSLIDESRNISNIPHVLFANIPQSTSTIEVLVFFPRMTHKNPHTSRWDTLIPGPIQDRFWEYVVFPTLKSILTDIQLAYFPIDRDHQFFRHGSRQPSPFAVPASQVAGMVAEMKRVVNDAPETLGVFGSMFFVLQIKGCKHLTRAEGPSPSKSLKASIRRMKINFPSLDWEDMQDADMGGQLYLDVAITTHPRYHTPLVGLWRLDSLDASFGRAGYLMGTMHNHNTLALYGSLQAEASPLRYEHSQVVFRSSYNLFYEAYRQKDNRRTLISTAGVYNRDFRTYEQIKELKEVFGKAERVTYGVRDEFRIGSGALNPMLCCIDDMVYEMHATMPILWIPSHFWFPFLTQRLSILWEAHGKVHLKQPNNYGILSGLFAYLLQSVIYTPPTVYDFVSSAMVSLRYRQMCRRFGMFFIHTFTLDGDMCIAELDDVDGPEVQRQLGAQKRKPVNCIVQRTVETNAMYPIGEEPTWRQVTSALHENVANLLGPWDGLTVHGEALSTDPDPTIAQGTRLFIEFTNQAWRLLNSPWKTRPGERDIRTLEEALGAWSADQIVRETTNRKFLASNIGFRGSSGPRVKPFYERVDLFFPSTPTDSRGYIWAVLGKDPGYIAQYQAALRAMPNDDERQSLRTTLSSLLHMCQALPIASSAIGSGFLWKASGRDGVEFATNPALYKIRSVKGADVTDKDRRTAQRRAPRSQVSRVAALKSLAVAQGFGARMVEKTYQRVVASRKALAKQNYRKPPQRRVSITERCQSPLGLAVGQVPRGREVGATQIGAEDAGSLFEGSSGDEEVETERRGDGSVLGNMGRAGSTPSDTEVDGEIDSDTSSNLESPCVTDDDDVWDMGADNTDDIA